MDDRQRCDLETLRQTHLQQIRVLEQQVVKFGIYVPAYIVTELEEHRQQVADLNRKLNIPQASEHASTTSIPVAISLAPAPTAPLEVFFSYAHKDEALRDKLVTHLSTLERQGAITDWHDRLISPGAEWVGQIDNHLNAAGIILLLISPDFIASDYCYGVELVRAMERHQAGQARVIPIILRPVDWTGTPFSKLQALPKDGKPITIWANEDEAFLDVAKGIRRAVQDIMTIS
jgi:hypothetical protein